MSVQNNKRCQFNAFQIKMFMAMLMVLDHLPYIPGLVPPFIGKYIPCSNTLRGGMVCI